MLFRSYDYVDIHVPTLERMYHKRLKGYAELGYQVKFGAADQSVSAIYDGYSSMLPFEQDLDDAARSVVIVSPYLQKGRIVKLLPIYRRRLLPAPKLRSISEQQRAENSQFKKVCVKRSRCWNRRALWFMRTRRSISGMPLLMKALCGMAAWIFFRLAEKIRMYFGSKTRILQVSSYPFPVTQKAYSLS